MASYPVHEPHGETHAGWIVDDPPHPVSQPTLCGRLVAAGSGQPPGYYSYRVSSEGLGVNGRG